MVQTFSDFKLPWDIPSTERLETLLSTHYAQDSLHNIICHNVSSATGAVEPGERVVTKWMPPLCL